MTRDEVVQKLLADPDARDAWLVLSDLLQVEGNPRGELLALELALEAQPGEELEARYRAFFDAHAPALYGDLLSQVVREGYGTVTWSRGYVRTLSYVGDAALGHQRAVKWLVTAICTQPEALTFLRKVDFSHTDLADPTPLACFTGLRELELAGTAMTSLDWLAQFPSVKKVGFKRCKISKDALLAARAAFPAVQFG